MPEFINSVERKSIHLLPSSQDDVFTNSSTSQYNPVKHAANGWQIQEQKCSLCRSQANGLRKGQFSFNHSIISYASEEKFVENKCLIDY